MKRLAHKHFWWPGLNKDVGQLVTTCEACRSVLNNTPKVPLQPWPVAERPWKRIHINFAGPFLDAMWFIIVDAYSKWPEVIQMKLGKTTTMAVINGLSEMFSPYGIAEEIVSDNGTQFMSEEFQQWCSQQGILHMHAKMKLHFNEHECAKAKDELTVGATVLACIYRGKDKWVQATIIQKKGSVMWLIKAAGSKKLWTRHSNQLCLINEADKRVQQELAPLNDAAEEAFHVIPDWTPDSVSDPASNTMQVPPPQSPAQAQLVKAMPGDRAQAVWPTLPPHHSNRERCQLEHYMP
uniref:RNA-directed DNA polymerase n=1 Tax=Plectus sambesii TaxID=2011161 RepID=A0A914XD63_9BILA